MNDRFEIEKNKVAFGIETLILTDKETGVQYLYVRNGAGGGLTPLINSNGSPLINGNINSIKSDEF